MLYCWSTSTAITFTKSNNRRAGIFYVHGPDIDTSGAALLYESDKSRGGQFHCYLSLKIKSYKFLWFHRGDPMVDIWKSRNGIHMKSNNTSIVLIISAFQSCPRIFLKPSPSKGLCSSCHKHFSSATTQQRKMRKGLREWLDSTYFLQFPQPNCTQKKRFCVWKRPFPQDSW